jgi:predicted NACHT family NTPase
MLVLALEFFDKLLEKLFLDAFKEKIKDYLERRNVQRTISRCSDVAAQALENYFLNEGICKKKVEVILDEVQQLITLAGVDAKMLTSASLDAEKLTDMILSKYPIPQRIKEEGLVWPFQMALQISSDTLCNIGTRFSEWEKEAWRRSFEAFDKLLQNQEKILESVGPGGEGSLDDRFSHTYRSHVLRRLAQIDASTFRVSSSLFLDLTTVFVQPNIIKVPKLKKKSKTGKKQYNRVVSLEEARKQVFLEEEDGDKKHGIRAEEFITKHKKCAIVGLPGTGKTTLLQHILLATVRGKISFNVTNGVIPVLVRVRQLDPNNLPGPDDLLRVTEGRVLAGARPGFLRRQLENGKVLLLIDGLDEIIVDKHDDLMKWISDFIELYPNSRYIISSRPVIFHPLCTTFR